MDIASLTIDSVREGLLARRFSAAEVAAEALRFAEAENPITNAFLHFSPERASENARRVDEHIARGEDPGPLAGVPVAVKDVIVTKGIRTTCGSKLLADYIPPYDATAVIRIEQAGGIIIGKTNCDEFAMGSSNENSAFGPVRNPVAPDRVPADRAADRRRRWRRGRRWLRWLGYRWFGPPAGVILRSGGCDADLRACLALWTDGLRQLARSHRSVCALGQGCRHLLRVIAGRDLCDSTSAEAPAPDYAALLDGNVKGLKLGLPREYLKELTSETGDLIHRAVDVFRRLGCEVREISLPATDYAIACYYIIATAEASSNLARYDGVRYTSRSPRGETLSDMYRNTRGEGFGAECKRRIMLGTYVLSAGYYDAYYLKAQKVRAMIARDFSNAFEQVDAIVAPVSPFPAFRLGEKVDNPVAMYLSDIFTITGSLAGIPCMSVPCGKTVEGLPVGMQLLTAHFAETAMFRLADAFEKNSEK